MTCPLQDVLKRVDKARDDAVNVRFNVESAALALGRGSAA